MTHCAICSKPLGRVYGSRNERATIVCAQCNANNETKTRAAEDRYHRAMRLAFESAARVWAANTMRREA